MVKNLLATVLLGLSLFFCSGQAQSADPIPGDSGEKGWYRCSGGGGEASTAASAEKSDPGVVREWKDARDGQIYQERLNQESGQFYTVRKPNKWESAKNEDSDNPRRYIQPNTDQPKRVISSRAPKKGETWTVGVVRMPKAMPIAAGKGLFWGVGLNKAENKLVKVSLLPLEMKADDKSDTRPAVFIAEGQLPENAPIIWGDRYPEKRWWKRMGDAYGETVIWNRDGQHFKLLNGFFDEPERLAKFVDVYGGKIPTSKAHMVQVPANEVFQQAKKLGYKNLSNGDMLMPGADLYDLRERHSQIPAIYFYQRLMKTGFPTFTVPFAAASFGIGSGIQVASALLDTRQFDIECLSNQKGMEAFERMQSNLKSSSALASVTPRYSAKAGISRVANAPPVDDCGRILSQLTAGAYPMGYAADELREMRWLYDREIRNEMFAGGGWSSSNVPPGTVATNSRAANFHWRPFGVYDADSGFWFGPTYEYGNWDWHYRSRGWNGDGEGRRWAAGLSSVYTTKTSWGGIKWYNKALFARFSDGQIHRAEGIFGTYVDAWHKPLWQNKSESVQLFSGFSGGVEVNTGSGLLADLSPTVLRIRVCGADALRIDPGIRFLMPWPAKTNLLGWGVKVMALDGGIGWYANFFPGHLNFKTFGGSLPRLINFARRIQACGIKEIPFPPADICPPTPVVKVPEAPCPPKIVPPPPPALETPPVKIKKKRPSKKKLRLRCPVEKPEMPIQVPPLPKLQSKLSLPDGHQASRQVPPKVM
ncbi:MAG: hypothetical protein WC643_00170 [Parcubacteria group bacterium]|jgi:hypothetical protein